MNKQKIIVYNNHTTIAGRIDGNYKKLILLNDNVITKRGGIKVIRLYQGTATFCPVAVEPLVIRTLYYPNYNRPIQTSQMKMDNFVKKKTP